MYTITRESFDSLANIWDTVKELHWNSIFVLPAWMKVWWEQFGSEYEPYLVAVREKEDIIGIAPFQIKDKTASLVGGENVCDYIDCVTRPGKERAFFETVLDEAKRNGIRQLDLGLLRPDSNVMTDLVDIARNQGLPVDIQQVDVSSEMDLPSSFDDYLSRLNSKQRHEVRRKLRRLDEAGKIFYRCQDGKDGMGKALDTFLHLFSLARDEKARFMTPEMEIFFNSLSRTMADIGFLRFGILEINDKPAAAVMCFDYNNSVYLYNSGFDPEYDSLSVGLMSKVLGIKESIQQGKKRFEFLKGNEIYKERLGGKEIPLYRCKIDIS